MATQLALIDTIDAAKEIAADRMDMSEILAKIESLIQVWAGGILSWRRPFWTLFRIIFSVIL